MRPPSNWVAAHGLRASDSERDDAISELRSRFAEGRLSQETFLYRMDAALRAKDQSELSHLFTDLPAGEAGAAPRGLRRLRGAGGLLGAGGARGAGGLRGAGRLRGAGLLARQRLSWPHRVIEPGPGAAPMLPARLLPLCLPRQEDGKFTIGRAPTCDFTVADLSVSRWHARLCREQEAWMLSDLGSTNGTRLNGWRVTSGVQVRPGDQVSFGSVTYVITTGPLAQAF